MRYIKIFEKFDSEEISKVLGFLSKKGIKSNVNTFLNDIKSVCNSYDIPESMLSNIKYMKSNDACNIWNFEINNHYGIYAVVFWFSLTDGYLSYSNVKDYKDDELLRKIKKEGYNKGKFVPVKFDELESGDKVFMFLWKSKIMDRFAMGEIFIEGQYLYLFQNTREGNIPDRTHPSSKGYLYSWGLGHKYDELEDHCMMYKYVATDEPIYIDDKSKDYKLGEIPEHYTGNKKVINNSDFALVMYLDDALMDIYDTVGTKTEIKKERVNSKENALALFSDKELKNKNIEKYIRTIYKKFNINNNGEDLSNLNSLLKVLIGGGIVGYFLISTFNFVENLNDFSSHLYLCLKDKDSHEKYESSLAWIYESSYKEMITYKNKVQDFSKIDDIDVKKLMIAIDKLSKVVLDKCDNYKVETVYDLRHFYQYFNSIKSIINDRYTDFNISNDFRGAVNDILSGRKSIRANKNIDSDIDAIDKLINRLNKPI